MQPAKAPTATDADIDAAVAQCGGDLRATIGALFADNAALERELSFAGLAMSYGFARGWFARQREQRRLASSRQESSRYSSASDLSP